MIKNAPKKILTQDEATNAAKALEVLFASSYIDKKKLYWENFVRGITFSIGGIIGATVGIALILWVLSIFNEIPFIGEISKTVQETINLSTN